MRHQLKLAYSCEGKKQTNMFLIVLQKQQH